MRNRLILALSAVVVVALLVSGCAPAATPEPEVITKVETQVVKETQVVEKEVVKEVGFKNVPRERTLVYQASGGYGAWTDTYIHNRYASGYHHQMGGAFEFEGLAYYLDLSDTIVPWLEESHEYNKDYTELTISLREGIEWSDGSPFTAGDVAFTLNMLRDNAPDLQYSGLVKEFVKEAVAADDLTCVIMFNKPAPHFWFETLCLKDDTGISFVPEKVYKDVDDILAFKFYDEDKGWPLTTASYRIAYETPTQKFFDRRDDWWAAKTGFQELPEAERILVIPYISDENAAQLIINNNTDTCLDLRPATIVSIFEQNPAVLAHTMGKPYGYICYWPVNMGWNDLEEPFNNPDIRWAINYALDRDRAIEVAYDGASVPLYLPFPDFPGLRPYKESIQDLMEEYPVDEYNLEKSAALMEKNGYVKDGAGFWTKDGERFHFDLGGWAIFADIGPILAEILRQGGFEVEFVMPPDHSNNMGIGKLDYGWLTGTGPSVRDPYQTLYDQYHASRVEPTGESGWNSIWRWKNEEFSAIVDEMGVTGTDDPKMFDLFHDAMEIWLRELPSVPVIEWVHRVPMNTTYWTGWPTEDDPYAHGAFWHMTAPRIVDRLQAVQ